MHLMGRIVDILMIPVVTCGDLNRTETRIIDKEIANFRHANSTDISRRKTIAKWKVNLEDDISAISGTILTTESML